MFELFQAIFWQEAKVAVSLIVPLIAITIVFKFIQSILFRGDK